MSIALRQPAGAGGGQPRHAVDAKARDAASTLRREVKIDKPAEWAEMFDDAWRTMKYRFYDRKMHGKDWDAMRGEVSAAGRVRRRPAGAAQHHQRDDRRAERLAHRRGAAGRGGARTAASRPAHLGLELEADERPDATR